MRRWPRRHAVSVAGHPITYADLWGRAGSVASDLLREVGPQHRIGLVTSRSVENYIAYWAAVRLGASIVPLNPAMSAPRMSVALVDAGINVLLYSEAHSALVDEIDVAVPRLAPIRVEPTTRNSQLSIPWAARHTRDSPEAYAIFTSGTTGAPKGVPITDENLVNWLPHIVRTYRTSGTMRVAQTADVAWDLTVFNMWLAWATGATLVDPGPTPLSAPEEFINTEEVTHWFSTPQSITMAELLGELEPDSMPSLRWSMFGGEPLRHEQASLWMRAASASRLANIYGPTELTCTCFDFVAPPDPSSWPTDSRGSLPIGAAHPNVEFVVRATTSEEASRSQGELLVRGPQRFNGYITPQDNIGRFVRPSGSSRAETDAGHRGEDWYKTGDLVEFGKDHKGGQVLYVVGRVDDQVKIDGNRVEPQEVERRARTCPGIEDVAVVDGLSSGSRRELSIFHVGSATGDLLLSHLRAGLPSYMVPVQAHPLDRLPQNVNGKVDRAYLRELASDS